MVIHVPGTVLIAEGTDGHSRGVWISDVSLTTSAYFPTEIPPCLLLLLEDDVVRVELSPSCSSECLAHDECILVISLAALLSWDAEAQVLVETVEPVEQEDVRVCCSVCVGKEACDGGTPCACEIDAMTKVPRF